MPEPTGEPTGGNPNPAPTGDPSPQPTPPVPAPDDALGDAGKRALTAERDARKAADKSAAESAEKVAQLEAEISRLRRANAASKGTDVDAIKDEIRAEFTGQLVEAQMLAEAKGRMQTPADVKLFLSAADFKSGDEDAIREAVDKLLKERPYLAAATPADGWGDVAGRDSGTEPEPTSPYARMARAYGRSKR